MTTTSEHQHFYHTLLHIVATIVFRNNPASRNILQHISHFTSEHLTFHLIEFITSHNTSPHRTPHLRHLTSEHRPSQKSHISPHRICHILPQRKSHLTEHLIFHPIGHLTWHLILKNISLLRTYHKTSNISYTTSKISQNIETSDIILIEHLAKKKDSLSRAWL